MEINQPKSYKPEMKAHKLGVLKSKRAQNKALVYMYALCTKNSYFYFLMLDIPVAFILKHCSVIFLSHTTNHKYFHVQAQINTNLKQQGKHNKNRKKTHMKVH